MRTLQDIILCFSILFLTFTNSECLNFTLNSQDDKSLIDDLSLCAKHLAKGNFDINSTITFHTAPNNDDLNNVVLNDIMRYLMNHEEKAPRYTITTACAPYTPKYYIIITTGVDDFSAFIEKEKRCTDWSAAAEYLVLSTSLQSVDEREYFRIAWAHNIFNLAILQSNASAHSIEILTWDLGCKKGHTEEEGNVTIKNCTGSEVLFPKGLSAHSSACLLKVAVNDFPPFTSRTSQDDDTVAGKFYSVNDFFGVEIELIKYICEKLNLTPQLRTSDKTTTNIVIEMVLQDELDVIVGDMKVNYYASKDFTFTYPHYYDEIHAVTRNTFYPDLIDDILGIFQLSVKIVYFSIFFIFLTLYVSVNLIAGKRRNMCNDFCEALVSAWAITLGLPAVLPRKARSLNALLVVVWIWMAFYARTVFQSALINILSQVAIHNSVNSVQDLCEQNFTIIVPDIDDIQLLYTNRSSADGTCRFSREHFVECLEMNECLEYALLMPNFATFVSVNFYENEKWKMLRDPKFGGAKFHFIREAIFSSPLAFQFKRGNPLADRFSRLARRFTEAGFMQYNLQKAKDHENLLRAMYRMNASETVFINAMQPSKFRQLTINHMAPILKLYLGGCLLSLCTALLEIITYYFTTMRRII